MDGSRLFFPIPKFLSVWRANLLWCFQGLPLDITNPLRKEQKALWGGKKTASRLPPSQIKTKNSTSIPSKCFKQWNGGTIYEVFSLFHQCLSHSFVPVQDNDSPTEKTKAENVSVLYCKLKAKSLKEGTAGIPTSPHHHVPPTAEMRKTTFTFHL